MADPGYVQCVPRPRRPQLAARRVARRRSHVPTSSRRHRTLLTRRQLELVTKDVERVVACIAAGGLAVVPTETVYGLGADAEQPAAVARMFEVKGRPPTTR